MTANERFHNTYISQQEICRLVGVSRASVAAARKDGRLPDAIEISDGHMYAWERAAVMPYLLKWKAALEFRRG